MSSPYQPPRMTTDESTCKTPLSLHWQRRVICWSMIACFGSSSLCAEVFYRIILPGPMRFWSINNLSFFLLVTCSVLVVVAIVLEIAFFNMQRVDRERE